jgi:hypothetical protein
MSNDTITINRWGGGGGVLAQPCLLSNTVKSPGAPAAPRRHAGLSGPPLCSAPRCARPLPAGPRPRLAARPPRRPPPPPPPPTKHAPPPRRQAGDPRVMLAISHALAQVGAGGTRRGRPETAACCSRRVPPAPTWIAQLQLPALTHTPTAPPPSTPGTPPNALSFHRPPPPAVDQAVGVRGARGGAGRAHAPPAQDHGRARNR